MDLLSITDACNSDCDAFFVGPRNLDLGFYRERFPRWEFLEFDPCHFASVRDYSTWMTSTQLYDRLREFEFMVLCQQDAVLIRAASCVNLDGLDYLGSPWNPAVRVLALGSRVSVYSNLGAPEGPWLTRVLGRRVQVGNGGLSIRRIEAMREVSSRLMREYPDGVRTGMLEDLYFCALGPRVGLRVAPPTLAGAVFAESGAARLKEPGTLVGLHGLEKWNPALLATLRHGV